MERGSASLRSRTWVFTENNPPGLLDWEVFQAAGVTYLLYQEEIGESGTHHHQGMLEFETKVRMSTVQNLFDTNPHLEICRDKKASKEYCKKPGAVGGPYEFGELSGGQGSRSDLSATKAAVDAGATTADLWESHHATMVRYHKAYAVYRNVKAVKRDWPMEIFLYLGPTRTGKTRAVRERWPDAYWKPGGKWWPKYEGQETVVVDEMYGHRFPFTELLQLLDRYPYQVEDKGVHMEFNSRRIVFTSNQEPEDWYNAERTHQVEWAQNPLNARLREFGTIIRTGEVHRAIAPVQAQFGLPQ